MKVACSQASRLPAAVLLALSLLSPATMAADTLADQVETIGQGITTAEFERLLAKLDSAGASRLKARAFMLRCHSQLGEDPRSVREVAAAGITVATAAAADSELGGLLLCRGYIEETTGNEDRAFADYDAAIVAATRGGDRAGMAQATVLRGEIQHYRGNYTEALQDMQSAYRAYVELGNDNQQSYALNAIANLYSDPRVGQYEQALDYYRQLLARHLARDKRGEVATSHFNIGSTLERLQRFPEALESFRAALAASSAGNDEDSIAETRRAMATMLLRMDRPEEALPLAELALRHALAGDSPQFVARVRLTRGEALQRSGRIREALVDLELARKHFKVADNPRFLEHIAGVRAEALARGQDWQQAYLARSEQLALGQRLGKQVNDELTSRLRVQFDSERKEEENAALQRENALRSRALADAERIRALQTTTIALGSLLLLVLAWMAWRSTRRAGLMRRLALTDELTGLPNRRAILDQLRQKLHSGDGAATCLLIFDIDHFKSINDRLGHDVGDVVLREVAAAAQLAVGRDGEVGRIGGEEFLVLMKSADLGEATQTGERLRLAIESLVFRDQAALKVSISLGGTCSAGGGEHMEEAVKRADLALYQAKEGGRNRMEWRLPTAGEAHVGFTPAAGLQPG